MLTEYRRDYTAFNEALSREFYLHYSGQKEEYELERIYDRYSDLFRLDAIEALRDEYERIAPDFETDRAAIAHLRTFAEEQYLAAQVKELTAEIAGHDAKARLVWDDQELSFHRSAVMLNNEPDADRRRRLYDERARLIGGTSDLRGARLARMHDLAKTLGYDHYIAMCQAWSGIDYEALNQNWQAFLGATEELYSLRLREVLLRDLKVMPEQAHRADVGYFTRLTHFDQHFPKERLIPVYQATLAELGIDVARQTNIKIDTAERPKKHSRAFCAPINIPAEVMLVVSPLGGQADYQVFFHEAGHAQHYGFTSPSLRAEFRYTGDRALTEMFASLLQYLILEPDWLQSMLGMREPEAFIQTLRLSKLFTLRRYAGKLSYELKLHAASDLSACADSYRAALTEATHFQYQPEEFLSDVDDGFYAADYLRAWASEVMLREYLRTKYGRTWWHNRRAGELLKEMWNTGNRYRLDELMAQVGAGTFSVEPLIDEFKQGLKE